MIGCPRCGGHDVRLLKAGLLECTSSVVVHVIPPGRQGNPTAIPVTEPCGHRFEVAMSAEPCECGLGSLGHCTECGRPVCHLHGTVVERRLLCDRCIAERREALAREQQEAAERAAAEAGERHVAAVQRVRVVAATTAAALSAAGVRQRTLARVRTRRRGVMDPYVWNQSEAVGRGWYIADWAESPLDNAPHISLRDDGELFWKTWRPDGSSHDPTPVIGHWARVLRTRVVAVDGPIDLESCSLGYLERLERDLEAAREARSLPLGR
jgi:hypothetical protein